MFSHESFPLIIIFIILFLGVLAAVLHPIHAIATWLRKRSEGSSRRRARKDSR